MPKLRIERLAPDAQVEPDLLGLRVTFELPDLPADIRTWRQFLYWLTRQPHATHALLKALYTLAPPLDHTPEP